MWGTLLFPDINRQLGFSWLCLSMRDKLSLNLSEPADNEFMMWFLANALIFGLLQKQLVLLLFFLNCREKLLVCFEGWLCSEEDCWIGSFWECRFWSTWSPVVLREKENGRCLPEWQDGFQRFKRLVTESYFNYIFIFLYPLSYLHPVLVPKSFTGIYALSFL